MALQVGFELSRAKKQPLDADYIVSGVSNKSDIPTYIQNLDIAHSGMQLYFEDLDLGVIVIDKPTGEYVELGGGGVAIVADNTEESELLANLQTTGSSENGQIIYNQSEDKYKKYFNGSLIESSGQIITEQERNRLIPEVVKFDDSNTNLLTIDSSTNEAEFNIELEHNGKIFRFDASSISFTGPIQIKLPHSELYPVGFHFFFIVTGGDRATDILSTDDTNGEVNPASNLQGIPKHMISFYNIREESASTNTWSVIGNIIDITN